ncbi:MAG: tRNA lysidine(34) synthetase TilS [Candidatus Delongbacteria bacterium]|nr:tRNA lysidine(34) synthetase TilS [Candidatus Delongbacteria bacterium]
MPGNELKSIVEKNLKILPSFNSKTKLAVSYSGGVDSAVLLDIVLFICKEMRLPVPAVIYFNHNLRGKESSQEKSFIISKFKHLGKNLRTIDLDVQTYSKRKNISIESAARELRYRNLDTILNQYDYILLGHHGDDNVETVLFNIFRGSGLQGLEGIKKLRGKYVRPLLEVSKSDILDYAEKNKIDYVTDSSNLKNDFSRNKIRNKIIPLIESELNRNIRNSINRLSNHISEVTGYLDKVVDERLDDISYIRSEYDGIIIINKEKFLQEDVVIKKSILNRAISLLGAYYNIDTKNIDLILAHIADNKKNVLQVQEFDLEITGNNILLVNSTKLKDISDLIISNERNSDLYFDKSKINNSIDIKSIDIENSFIPFGKSKSEKIRKILSDKKIPKLFRDKLKVIMDGEIVIFIQGVGISEVIKADEATKEKTYISIKNNYLDILF